VASIALDWESQTERRAKEISGRACVRGKFIWSPGGKLYIRGVTYGTFGRNGQGEEYCRDHVERDFAAMQASGVNAIRTYTVPPRWLLDTAAAHDICVLVGIAWEQHLAFLEDPKRGDAIADCIRAGVRACAGHPAVLAYAVGNEIPASIVRWYGHRRIERFLHRLYRVAKDEDPAALVTYVNYPSTEYLDLPFIDFVCFNVYLESPTKLEAYLARLQNLAGSRPLVIAECGLDSRRHGELAQAWAVEWQVRTAFGTGCAGTFVFAWTDEWHRGGHDVVDWDFGLTNRRRDPKPALATLRHVYAEVPFPHDLDWPKISVVLCSYNGASVIRDCLEGIQELDYPNFEAIVVDDGSTDATATIAREMGFWVISTPNQGLSAARNTGMEAAAGEIIAYIDDDARPDPHWLTYLAATFMRTDYVGVGGPNIPPPGDGQVADCVANAPGGPIHVLLSDQVAEHIPGCNSAFRKSALQAVGGFDPQFRTAGDDVDVCWKLQERGGALGFSPGAMVWHHRRNSIRAYWRQQVGYGKAEALLERKWPDKYNGAGHLVWGGRIYGDGLPWFIRGRGRRIYHGTWGTAAFQSSYEQEPGLLACLVAMPEWYLILAFLAGLSLLGLLWSPLLVAVPLLVLGAAASIVQAGLGANKVSFHVTPRSRRLTVYLRILTSMLHLIQPLARLRGRMIQGLTPWRLHGRPTKPALFAHTVAIWSERWRAPEAWLTDLESALKEQRLAVRRGGDFERWDFEVRGGLLGAAAVRAAIEEHGAGKQLIRFYVRPRLLVRGWWITLVLITTALVALMAQAWLPAAILGAAGLLMLGRALEESAAANAALLEPIRALGQLVEWRRESTMIARLVAARAGMLR
jgi:O-antigen biosynthesis protein